MASWINITGGGRGIRRRLVISIAAILLGAIPASVADACSVPVRHPQRVNALQADAVITGRVRNYDRGPDRYRPFPVEVKQVLRGDPGRRISVAWGASNIEVDETLNGDYVFVLRRANPSFDREARADYIISQGPCSGASIFPKGSADANAIRDQFGLEPQVAETPWERPSIALLSCILLGVSGAFAGGVFLWSRRKKARP